MERRCFLQAGLATAELSLLLASGLVPTRVLAEWPSDAFHAGNMAEIERILFGDAQIEDTDQITIDAPDIAENGAKVPVDVRVQLPGAESLVLLSEKNPFPLLAQAHFTPEVESDLSVRVKMGDTGNLVAIVEADGKLYRAVRAVKVAAGGCGA
ncbi:MAG: thiosulfate oxidation carrier protein SoxY [Pseudomonadota bacterium]|nr:thiosulfate oxidation carrier protein SoxY [Pseudomonadota bacterium]